MIELEKYFDIKAWNNLVSLYRDKWVDNEYQLQLVKELSEEKDVAIVIWGEFKDYSKSWIKMKIPALDDIRPVDCLKDEQLLKRLKVCLLRIP